MTEDKPTTAASTGAIADLSFLVAEDQEFQRNTMVWILAGLGATKIHEAADGREALAIIEDAARPVDVVITDLDMPGMDGMEFIRHLGRAGHRVSIILASALEPRLLMSIVPMAEAYGINLLGVIEKPLTPEKLMRLVGHHHRVRAVEEVEAYTVFASDELLAGLDNDEFRPYFQPKVDLRTGVLRGAEALARWHHPERGVVLPSSFISTLEDNGSIDALSWIIFRKAFTACCEWQRAGIDADISVNLSIKSLDDVKFADRMSRLASSCGIPPDQVMLEITESATTTDLGHVLENLARLRMAGFGLSIDDYGRGYSSMQQLTRISFTELKIDRSFVAGSSRQESSRLILESCLELANRLGLATVAEGVETRGDLDLLRGLGCSMAQGYLIAAPMEYETWIGWAKSWDPQFVQGPAG